jgi:1,2-dihydroxy-3-keto-5-methylthiopentene dioxygenase
MSRLRIYTDTAPETTLLDNRDGAVISAELARIGVTFERWQANQPIEPGASQETVIAAYKDDIDRLVAARGFSNVDVVSIAPDNPKREEMRAKFLDEHFHIEDEVRFFVAGSGQFTLHVDGKVYEIECMKNDLIAVPDRALHWFDMGAEPHFVAIRFFTDPAGWVGHFTGSDIAKRFPRYEPAAAGQAA